MKVLVCGGRDFNDVDKLYYTLAPIDIDIIISGHARGADQLGEMFAHQYNIPVEVYPANWDIHGKRAGFIRNQQMLDEGKPDLVIAFPGGVGTADMVRRAKAAGVEVIEVK